MESSISVCVRVRPLTVKEEGQIAPQSSTPFFPDGTLSLSTPISNYKSTSLRKIVKCLDDRVLVFDPPESNPIASYQRQLLGPKASKKVKDVRFCFDAVFDEASTQEEVYTGAAKQLVGTVLSGFNGTIFAYGATGKRAP